MYLLSYLLKFAWKSEFLNFIFKLVPSYLPTYCQINIILLLPPLQGSIPDKLNST